MKGAYYNEIDHYAAEWLRRLIAAGHIAPGDVDERSIVDVRPDDLRGYVQCHFFAGIGVWSHALRTAGWPDDREVWTGSCPCQAFSAAGRRGGFDDERHLWPYWFRLIGELRPGTVFGEQVASADGLAWLDFVCADMEGEDYAIAPLDLCAAGFGAPHIRQRIFFVAHTERGAAERRGHDLAGEAQGAEGEARERQRLRDESRAGSDLGDVADSNQGERRPGRHGPIEETRAHGQFAGHRLPRSMGDSESDGRLEWRAESAWLEGRHLPAGAGGDGLMGDAGQQGQQGREQRTSCNGHGGRQEAHGSASESGGTPGPCNGFWRGADWLPCIDGKARPVEPGTFPLAHGATARVGRLRAYGNAIVAPVAAEFIGAYMSIRSGSRGTPAP